MVEFFHGTSGLTRFPPNVEQITVMRESTATWLVIRRNEVELRFPLTSADCNHLANLLISDGSSSIPETVSPSA
jgi:hypothetical protein